MIVFQHFKIHSLIKYGWALLMLSVTQINAQSDSLNGKSFRFFLSDQIERQTKNNFADSEFLDGFQVTNPYFINYTSASAYLGNLGSALRTDYFGLPDDLNFHYRKNYFGYYHYFDRPAGYDGTRKIHSMMEYYRGAKKEQDFQIMHSQRLSKNFAFGLDYKNIISPSFYKHATATDRAFDIYFIFESSNNRYSLFADYVSNRTDNNINGGLVSDTSLENASGIDVKTLPVNLDDAQWLTKQKNYILKQQYNFKVASSTNSITSGDTTLKSYIINKPQIFVHHDFKYSTYGELFTSANDSIWTDTYYDTLSTVDTASTEQFLNSVYFQSMLWGEFIQLKAGVNNQWLNFTQRDIDSNITRTSLLASASVDFNQMFDAVVYYEQNIIGNANGSYMLKADINYTFKSTSLGKLNLQLLNSKQPVYIMSNVYYTNHFIHNNDFTFTGNNLVAINYLRNRLAAGARINSVKNFVYHNENTMPVQHQSLLTYTTIYLRFNYRLKKFNWYNDFSFIVNSNKEIIHLPVTSLHSSVYYDDYLFNKVMRAQVGFDVFYNTAYHADAFMPALQDFYLQSNSTIGNYPFIDFFASAKIRTAKIFIKLENIGSGWLGKDYFSSPNYPLQGRGFRFGLQWGFFS